MTPEGLKKLVNKSHIVSATTDIDTIRNVCKGTGQVAFRCQNPEEADGVKIKLIKEGYKVQEHAVNPNKKPHFTDEKFSPSKRKM